MAKNYNNLIMILIFDETLLRLGVQILSTGNLEDEGSRFTKVTEYNNIDFDRKMLKDKNGKEDGKEVVTNLEEKASKKRV